MNQGAQQTIGHTHDNNVSSWTNQIAVFKSMLRAYGSESSGEQYGLDTISKTGRISKPRIPAEANLVIASKLLFSVTNRHLG